MRCADGGLTSAHPLLEWRIVNDQISPVRKAFHEAGKERLGGVIFTYYSACSGDVQE